MPIKINGKDLQKRIINGKEVEKVMCNGVQIRPDEITFPYLCFTAVEAGSTIKLNKVGTPTVVTLETSTDGTNWSTYTFGNTITLYNEGDKIYRRNTSTTDTGFSTAGSSCYQFAMTGEIAASGDVNYLLNKNSTTTLSDGCYNYLFRDCSVLTTPPELPATTIAASCYEGMFQGCSWLTTVPSLPATTMQYQCYAFMFSQCSLLETLPNLPATTLDTNCYSRMFYGCHRIKISETQTGAYQTPYRIPTTGTASTAQTPVEYMFFGTGGTFKGTPNVNQTYYTSNTVI